MRRLFSKQIVKHCDQENRAGKHTFPLDVLVALHEAEFLDVSYAQRLPFVEPHTSRQRSALIEREQFAREVPPEDFAITHLRNLEFAVLDINDPVEPARQGS